MLAGGSGTRLGGGVNKVYRKIGGKAVLERSFEALAASGYIDDIIIVCRETEREEAGAFASGVPVRLVRGGDTRQESVYNALQEDCGEIVVIHDGARPFVTPDCVRRCVEALDGADGATAAVRSKDTVKLADADGFVEQTVPRERAWQIQTPQCFRTVELREAHRRFRAEPGITDDCMLMEKAGGRVRLVEADYRNIKITTPEDMILAEAFLNDNPD